MSVAFTERSANASAVSGEGTRKCGDAHERNGALEHGAASSSSSPSGLSASSDDANDTDADVQHPGFACQQEDCAYRRHSSLDKLSFDSADSDSLLVSTAHAVTEANNEDSPPDACALRVLPHSPSPSPSSSRNISASSSKSVVAPAWAQLSAKSTSKAGLTSLAPIVEDAEDSDDDLHDDGLSRSAGPKLVQRGRSRSFSGVARSLTTSVVAVDASPSSVRSRSTATSPKLPPLPTKAKANRAVQAFRTLKRRLSSSMDLRRGSSSSATLGSSSSKSLSVAAVLTNSSSKNKLDLCDARDEITVTGLLGVGGSAHVVRGSLYGFSFAIKRWDATLLLDTDRANVHNEAALLLSLQHPNIVRAMAFDSVGDELRLYMQEYSCTLRDVLNRRRATNAAGVDVFYRFERDETVDVLLQIARGLEHIHASNVVHRDLKAENVFVQRTTAPDIVFERLSMSMVVRRNSAVNAREGDGDGVGGSGGDHKDEYDGELAVADDCSPARAMRAGDLHDGFVDAIDDSWRRSPHFALPRLRAPRVIEMVAIGDFGEATVCQQELTASTGVESASEGSDRAKFVTASAALVGSPTHMAPEVVQHRRCSPAVDVWAFGCVLLEVLTGLEPYELERVESFELIDHIGSGARPRLPAEARKQADWRDVVALFDACTALDPQSRPSAREIVSTLDHHHE